MNGFGRKLLLLFIFVEAKAEKLFGLSHFSLGNKRFDKLSSLSSCAIRVSFVILYPISCLKVLSFFTTKDSDVTMYARNLTFAFNWLLLVFIYANETFVADSNQQGFGEIKRLMRKLTQLQTTRDNLILLLKCALKMTLMLSGLVYFSYRKYMLRAKRGLQMPEKAFIVVLFLPFVILSLASNRIYVANTVVRQFLEWNTNQSKSTALADSRRMKLCAINYSRLHRFFADFNKLNAINLLVVITFCVLNIVYEVMRA